MARRRELNVFSWSFLDAITCGFGAVVLTFIIITAQVADNADKAKVDLKSETTRLEEQVLDARKDLVRFRNSMLETQETERTRASEAARIRAILAQLQLALPKAEGDSLARKESIEKLRSDVKQLEEANQRLAARALEPTPNTGQRIRSFVGEGNRQYLTGLKVGGKRILVLVDASTSMLGRDYINVLRYRSMPPGEQRRAPKWRQVVRSVDWITTQIPKGSQYQIYAFNEQAHSVVEGSDGKWLQADDGNGLTSAVASLGKITPAKGTSLINAFAVTSTLSPAPDIVYLLTDGLPTQGDQPPGQVEQVDYQKRRAFFDKARRSLHGRIPLNVMLYPMDGDPEAPYLFWDLAVSTGGALLTPSEDWP
jgi:hypothetical protein